MEVGEKRGRDNEGKVSFLMYTQIGRQRQDKIERDKENRDEF